MSFYNIVNEKLQNGSFTSILDIGSYYGFGEEFMELSQLEDNVLTDSLPLDEFLTTHLHLCPDKYEVSKNAFNLHFDNMLEFLKDYNMNDCRLLCEGIEKYSNGFLGSCLL